MTDPIWWLYLFWIPDFLNRNHGLNLQTMGLPLVVIYLIGDVGSIGGGWLSSALIKRGWSVNAGRKTAMLTWRSRSCRSWAWRTHSLWTAVLLVGLPAAAHQGWSANLFTLVSDTFPRKAVGSVVGLGGTAGAIGGMLIAKPLGVLFGVGCHAVCLGHDNLLISADYPGYAQRIIEQELDGGIALFVNLTEGNIIPCTRPRYDSLDTRGYLGGSFADAEKVGDSLAREVLRCLADARPQDLNLFHVDKHTFTVRPARHDLSMISAWKRLLARRQIILEYLLGFRKASPFNLKPVFTLWRDASSVVIERRMSEKEMRRLMAAVSDFLMMAMRLTNPAIRKPIPVSVQVIQIDDYRLMTLPGEALVEVGRGWQECNHPYEQAAYVIGLANGFMGYLPHPDNFAEPGADLKYETIMNALEPDATLLALKQARQMLKV